MEQASLALNTDKPAPDKAVETPVNPPDKQIWGMYILMCIISIVELYSASSREVESGGLGVFGPVIRHLVCLFLGLLIMLGLQRTHYKHFHGKPIVYFIVISVILMIYTMFFGEKINDARRAFKFIISIQPAELIKLSAVLGIAYISQLSLTRKGGVTRKGVITMAVLVAGLCALLLPQGNTNTLLLMGISFLMFVVCGVKGKHLVAVLGFYCLAGFLMWGAMKLYHSVTAKAPEEKVEQTEQLDPYAVPQAPTTATDKKASPFRFGTFEKRLKRHIGNGQPKYKEPITPINRQEMYSYMAQANGGLKGVGPGNSRETARLPLAFSDYIYAIIVEEWGLIGGLCILLLYVWILLRGSILAGKCNRAFPSFLVLGMSLMIVCQAMAHIGIVTGFLPVSGQPLPLISQGGSSIIVTSIALGIMLSVSRHTVRNGNRKDVKREQEELPELLRTANPSQF